MMRKKTVRLVILLLLCPTVIVSGKFVIEVIQRDRVLQRLRAAGGYVQTCNEPPESIKTVFGERIFDLLSSPKTIEFNGELGDPSRLNDDLLCEIVHISTLRNLSIFDCSVSGEGFKCLNDSSHIEKLVIDGCPIKDGTIKHLVRLKELEQLGIYGEHITSQSVGTISELSSLKELAVWDTTFNEDDVQEIQPSLPVCRVLVATKDPNSKCGASRVRIYHPRRN